MISSCTCLIKKSDLSLTDDEFGAAMEWRLDVGSLEARQAAAAGCLSKRCALSVAQKDVQGHVDTCPVGGGLIQRHDNLVREIGRIGTAAGVGIRYDTRGHGINQGGVDLFCEGLEGVKKSVGCDVRITSAAAQQALDAGSHRVPLVAARIAVDEKAKKHKASMQKIGYENWPLVCEVQGGFHPGVTKMLQLFVDTAVVKGKLGCLYPENAPWTAPTPLSFLKQRVAIKLIRERVAAHSKVIKGIPGNNKNVLQKVVVQGLQKVQEALAKATGGTGKAGKGKPVGKSKKVVTQERPKLKVASSSSSARSVASSKGKMGGSGRVLRSGMGKVVQKK